MNIRTIWRFVTSSWHKIAFQCMGFVMCAMFYALKSDVMCSFIYCSAKQSVYAYYLESNFSKHYRRHFKAYRGRRRPLEPFLGTAVGHPLCTWSRVIKSWFFGRRKMEPNRPISVLDQFNSLWLYINHSSINYVGSQTNNWFETDIDSIITTVV